MDEHSQKQEHHEQPVMHDHEPGQHAYTQQPLAAPEFNWKTDTSVGGLIAVAIILLIVAGRYTRKSKGG